MDISQRIKDLEFFYKEGQIDEKTYKEELTKVKKEYNEKIFNIKLKIGIIIVLLLILISMIYWGFFNLGKKYAYVSDLNNLPDPVQAETTGTKHLEKDGSVANLEYMARYTISGKVVNLQEYLPTNTYNEFIPLDIGLAWGKIGSKEAKGKISFWSVQDRFLRHNIIDKAWINSVGGNDYLNRKSSNSHLIASTDEIAKIMNRIRVNDYVRIEGFLVEFDLLDKKGARYTAKSSTNRTDSGDGACELIYVTNIVWLKEK